MAEPILLHVLEEVGQDDHCETVKLLRSRQAIVVRRRNPIPVFEVYLCTADKPSAQADLATLKAHGKIEVITEADYVRRFTPRSTLPGTNPPVRRDRGGPYIL
jgi:hypothetical protein